MRSTAKVVTWALLALFALAVLVFCVSNREAVTVSLYPLPWTITEIPLFIWMFGMLAVGSFVGMVVAWIAGHDGRRLSHERKKRIKELEKQLSEVQTRQYHIEHEAKPASPPSVALPSPAPRDAA